MSANLDLLRAVAVLCVFFSHLYEILLKRHTDPSHHVGQLGVILFFVHTSLVLMMSLERSESKGSALFREFFIHRFFRLYPLSIICVTVAFLVPHSDWSLREFITNLTLTHNLTFDRSMVGGLWTLPLEVQMYLMLPFLFLWLRHKNASWVLVLWLVSLPVALAQPLVSARLEVFGYVPCFMGGVVAWHLKRRHILPAWLWPLGIAAASFPWMMSAGNQLLPRYATCLALGLMIPLFREIRSTWLTGLSKTIAKYSYGIYLTHIAAMTIVFKHMTNLSTVLQAAAFVVIALAFPLLAYHLVEHPMIRFGKRIAVRHSMRPVSGIPVAPQSGSTHEVAEMDSHFDAT